MIRFVATATVIAAIISAGPVFAASSNPRPATAQSRRAPADDVEARIKTLHQDLRITAEQEAMWTDVAQVMRDNANRMKELRAKVQQPQPGNAVEQLNSYAQVVDAHSDGVHRFIPAFQKLYDSMSEAQKKTADRVLSTRVKEAARRHTR